MSCWSVHRLTVGSLARHLTAPFSTRRKTPAVKRLAMIRVLMMPWPIANCSSQPRAAVAISTSRPRHRLPSSRQPSPSSWCKLRCFFNQCLRRKTLYNNKTNQITFYQSRSSSRSIIAGMRTTTSNNFQAQRKCLSPCKRAASWASHPQRSPGPQRGAASSSQIRLSLSPQPRLTWHCVRSKLTCKHQKIGLEVCQTLQGSAARQRLWPTLHPYPKAVENQLNRYITTITTRHAVIRNLQNNCSNRLSSLTP